MFPYVANSVSGTLSLMESRYRETRLCTAPPCADCIDLSPLAIGALLLIYGFTNKHNQCVTSSAKKEQRR